MQPRRLLVIRHAQADGGPVDADRALTERGRQQAAALGLWLEQAGLVPDRVFVSPARRAVQTWEQAVAALVPAPPSIIEARIYDNTVEALLTVLRETPGDAQTVALVGHNPSAAELTAVLDDGQGSPRARGDAGAGFRPGSVATFSLAGPFSAIAPGTATLTDFAVPSD